MKNLIYDFYGIYVEYINGNYFEYENMHYFCLECKLEEAAFIKQYQVYEQSFFNTGGTHHLYLVKNRYQHYISSNRILLCSRDKEVYLTELIQQSLFPIETGRYEEIINKWIKEMALVENRVLPAIMGQSHQFEYLYALTIYYLGMAESALAYLQDCFNKTMTFQKSLSLHARQLDTYLDWLNPFCYRTDHYLNFLVRMYSRSYLTIDQVKEYTISFQPSDLIYMYSAMLYPEDFFSDILLYVQDQIDEKAFVKYYQHIEINEKRLKDFYTFIAEPTQLRPLEWL